MNRAFRCETAVYRAVDRAEYWRLRATRSGPTRTPEQDDDGLAPGEDPRNALLITGRAVGGWAPIDGDRLMIAFPNTGTGEPKVIVVATNRGEGYPNAMKPGEWRPFTG